MHSRLGYAALEKSNTGIQTPNIKACNFWQLSSCKMQIMFVENKYL